MHFKLRARLVDDFLQLFSILFGVEFLRLPERLPNSLVILFQFLNDFASCRRIISTCHFLLLRVNTLVKRRELMPHGPYLRRIAALSKPRTVRSASNRVATFVHFVERAGFNVTAAARRVSAFMTRLKYVNESSVALGLPAAMQSPGMTSA